MYRPDLSLYPVTVRRFLSYCLVALLLAACAREEDLRTQGDGPVLTLTVQTEEDLPTKAGSVYDQAGENAYHENELQWVDFYFYPDGNTSRNATYHRREKLTRLTRTTAIFRFDDLTTSIVNDRIFPVATETTRTLVFALANVDQTMLDSQDNTSLDSLQTLLVQTDFSAKTDKENHRQPSFMMSGQTTIRLKGRTSKEVIENDDNSIIRLKRYACKLTLGINTKDHVDIQTTRKDAQGNPIFEVWTPCVEEMKIYINDAVNTVSLDGEPMDTRKGIPDGYALTYRNNPMVFFNNNGTDANPDYELIFDPSDGYYNTFPTYMYPQRWANGQEGEPYLKLVLPWERTPYAPNDIKYAKKEFYYKIMIPNDVRGGEYINTFVRNNWYHYNVEVGMLGADTDDSAVAINPIDMYVYYWQDKDVVIKQADIGNARYLSVEENRYTLMNLDTLHVRFTSSHPVDFKVNSVTRPYFGQVDGKKVKIGDTVLGGTLCRGEKGNYLEYSEEQRIAMNAGTKYEGQDWFNLEGGAVVLRHFLDNEYASSMFDYSQYSMSLTIWHEDKKSDDPDYSKMVTIEQYPAVYIEAEKNSDPRIGGSGDDDVEINDQSAWQNYDNNGFVFVDGQRRMRHTEGKNEQGIYGTLAKRLSDGTLTDEDRHLPYAWSLSGYRGPVRPALEWLQWRVVNYSGGNRYLYTIHVSVLPSTSKFIIGDPRTLTPVTWKGGPDNRPGWEEKSTWTDAWWSGKKPDKNPTPDTQIEFYYNYQDGVDDFNYKTCFEKGKPIEGGEDRDLTWYYPADESTRTEQMLAPAVRVASKFGGVEYYDGITKQSAEFKCATYQEDGYPAGRWRLPTFAEIEFMFTLNANDTFIPLFSSGSSYWSAHGSVTVSKNSTTGKITVSLNRSKDYALARCVYDAWYWDPYNDRLTPDQRNDYYLGDMPRL